MYGDIPFEIFTVKDPSEPPDDDTFVEDILDNSVFELIVNVSIAVQLFSVFVTDKI